MPEQQRTITFEKITAAFLAVLEKHGFTRQTITLPHPTDSEYAAIIRDEVGSWFEREVEEPISPNQNQIKYHPTNLTQGKLDHMSLECALILLDNGVGARRIHYNESLNVVRLIIGNILVRMGYEEPRQLLRMSPLWGCYPLWEEVAKKAGLSKSEVSGTRAWFREHRPEAFQP